MGKVNEVSLGTYAFEKATRRTKRFFRDDGDRVVVQYISKDVLAKLGDPNEIEVVIRVPGED